MRLENLSQIATDGASSIVTSYSLSTTQWSLLAVAVFFSSGHWYGSAFPIESLAIE